MTDGPRMFDLTGRTALVTGAGGGLGRAFAVALSRQGAAVWCVDLDGALAAKTAAMIGGTLYARTDIADPASVSALAAEVADRTPDLHILINNAGIATLPARLPDVTLEDWDRAVSVNLRGLFLATRAILPLILGRAGASIVNISSYLGLVGAYPGFPLTSIAYGATKAGVIGFTRQLAAEYAATGMRVNAIAPGWHGGTRLGRARRATATQADLDQFESYINDTVPMGHRGVPEDMDGLVVYLASDASRYMTGQVLAHDGGLTSV